MMNKSSAAKAMEKLAVKISTEKFREKVREGIAKENDKFRKEEASLHTSRRQYLQTYDL